jgi:hypothetical protein
MDSTLLLGVLIGLVTGIVANLLTPFVKPLWARFRTLQTHGYHSQLRQQLKVLQNDLDQHNRYTTGSNRDLLLFLFQWLVAVLAVFGVAAACAFLGLALDAAEAIRAKLLTASLVCVILATVMSMVILVQCRDFTSSGAPRKRASLELRLAKLRAKLPNDS